MERTEPSLVPEWLKGAGCGGNVHHTLHQDDGSLRPQRSSLLGINSDNDSPRYAPPRRLGGPFSPVYEKNGYSSGRVYPNFSSSSRSGPYRNSYDSADRTDWDLDKERDSRLGGYSTDAKDDRPEARWGSSGSARFGQEFSARRFNAGGNTYSDRKNENGLGTGSPGSAQKAVFDRNFPSLNAQHAQPEKPYSTLGNVSGLSPRHHWQHASRPGDAANASSESWTSSLAEPIPNGQAHPPPAPPLPSMNGPKMAEALAPRVRTPPQLSAETQKLEELALKQSRQLVPMIPKTTTPNSKPKPKMVAQVTTSKAVAGSQLVSGYRPQGVSRPETGKLHVLTKPDGGAGTPPASAAAGARNTGVAAPASNAGPRKQKQLLDRRALPIPPLPANAVQEAAPSVARPKENGIPEDKRLSQNRSDFFNTLRKKAATAGNGSHGKQDGGSSQKADSTIAATGSEDSKFEHQNGGSGLVESAESGDDNVDTSKDKLPTSNGVSNGCYEQQHSRPDAVRVSEEEEAAFLRSLGWKEEDDVEGGLTEEEINAFYQHMRSMTSSPLSSKRHMKLNAVLEMRVGGVSPGISSSDSESDGEALNNARRQA